jgi:hypothetical protein
MKTLTIALALVFAGCLDAEDDSVADDGLVEGLVAIDANVPDEVLEGLNAIYAEQDRMVRLQEGRNDMGTEVDETHPGRQRWTHPQK